jgi:hypothetical protein
MKKKRTEPEMVSIANPIYDVVFRFMMDDEKVAKIFLSALLGKEILSLEFRPTEFTTPAPGDNSIVLTRMDFNAKILENNGEESVVIIELQRAKYYFQIDRFRGYLGRQYQNKNNVDKEGVPLPLYPIYILGESFTDEKIPVVRIERSSYDAATGKALTKKYRFMEALTHDSLVVQVPYLKKSRRNLAEQLLGLFDQSQFKGRTAHFFNIRPEDYPTVFYDVIRRLQLACATPDIEQKMEIEDNLLNELNKRDELLELEKKEKERAQQEASVARKEVKAVQKQVEAAKQQAETERAEKEAAKQQAETERAEKEAAQQKIAKLLNAYEKSVLKMAALGLDAEQIAETLELGMEEVQQILGIDKR